MMPLLADAGVPMLVIELPLMAMALVPVVLIEVAVVRKSVAVPYRTALLDVGLANVGSTLLGVPLAWGVMLAIEIVAALATQGGVQPDASSPVTMLAALVLQVAWLGPYEDHIRWMIPAAATVLLIPSFLVSVPIERWILVRRWRDADKPTVRAAVLWANVWSYALLLVAGSIWTVVSLR